MPVTYTNRKGRTYFLCKGSTKTGKPRYYFAREIKGEPVDEIPEGYRISESVNGIVSLVRDRPGAIHAAELALLEDEVGRHPESGRYRVHARHDRIVVYEMAGPDAGDLAAIFRNSGFEISGLEDRIQEDLERSSPFSPVMQFILSDREQDLFRAQRWCYLGGIDDWIDVEYGPLQELVPRLIPRLGTDAFFDLD